LSKFVDKRSQFLREVCLTASSSSRSDLERNRKESGIVTVSMASHKRFDLISCCHGTHLLFD
jgi:hypothetical protein